MSETKHKPSSLTVKRTETIQKEIEDLRILADMIESHGVTKLYELLEILKEDPEKKIAEAEKMSQKNCICRGFSFCGSCFKFSVV